MGKPIIGSNHRATRIQIILPVDLNGDWAFDENGDPVKGRTPVEVSVPRFDCMTPDDFKAVNAAIEALDDEKGADGKPLSGRDKGMKTALAMVRPFVDDAQFGVLSKLNLFELEQIAERLQDGSSITVGELLASPDS